MKKQFMDYIRGSAQEMTKVTWPTKKQAVQLTIIVLAFCAAATVVFGVVDFLLAEGYTYILNSTR